ncbi:hypothetical protein P175DRAFT_0439724 [Aspergillus ochraceoroseus IBT 24754]|uniref:Metallo-beta-lactamase domain-containing protein n=3 Tax=Aspergillus subgen. Nidulantes TaxID=2720870 RepID=A0A0F8X9M3_9EURO|nr:uncharacterized protein P175DRAFT_0439724 [Aspergillus ochraceoroseus IBT 24754]KKK20297.1 hypothetical protein ARAM_002429 [Aspergillus rambellii]KKK24818.1 hypothetical protein AOCH_000264 [Aspergillus ochraceoroseus]PTU20441.1 hypothetical protein P175DRAFT_0439724 [Aspergillus ochraceoroseus IBT 24754]
MSSSLFLARPKTPPQLHIPSSSSTVTVRVIDSTTSLFLNPPLFWQPEVKGFNGINVPIYCFLVSNGDRHVLFDLGVRRDWDNYAPKTVDLIRRTTQVKTEKNVSEILDSHEDWVGPGPAVRSKDIEAVIWSHHHFDHIGDPSTFPPSTDLVLGPGVKAFCWPAYPSNPDSLVLDSDIQGRKVREIDFAADSPQICKIGRFNAFDYFGDGSFYLLDAPGHSLGHLCALARVTAGPDGDSDNSSFVFMGADACHHPGVLRPTEYLPLPVGISPSPVRKYPHICPGEMLQGLQPHGNATEPFFTLSPVLFPEYDVALDTVRKIEELDAADNIFIILAHDESIKESLDLFPRPINDWKAKGLRSETRWLFCKDFEDALH